MLTRMIHHYYYYYYYRILNDFRGMEKSSLDSIKVIVVEFGEQMRVKGDLDMKAASQFRKVRM